jgi:hypothetical protein
VVESLVAEADAVEALFEQHGSSIGGSLPSRFIPPSNAMMRWCESRMGMVSLVRAISKAMHGLGGVRTFQAKLCT